jgi:hypothetical protein
MTRLLIELGADLEAQDDLGRTPLAVAMLRGDLEAIRLLEDAGALEPTNEARALDAKRMREMQETATKIVPMLCVGDVPATVARYTSLGFTLRDRQPPAGPIEWAYLSFGKFELMVQSRVGRPRDQIALWFYTGRVGDLYDAFRARQLEASRSALAGKPADAPAVEFKEDLYTPFYGGRQFSVADVNGFELVFYTP